MTDSLHTKNYSQNHARPTINPKENDLVVLIGTLSYPYSWPRGWPTRDRRFSAHPGHAIKTRPISAPGNHLVKTLSLQHILYQCYHDKFEWCLVCCSLCNHTSDSVPILLKHKNLNCRLYAKYEVYMKLQQAEALYELHGLFKLAAQDNKEYKTPGIKT